MDNILIVSTILLWILMLFNILMTIGLARRINRRLPKVESLNIGDQVPKFEASTLDGEAATYSHYVEKPVAFIFLSPGCDPCRHEMDHLASLRSTAKQFGITLVLVSDADEKETAAFYDDYEVDLPILVAPRGRTSFLDDFKVNIWPSYYLTDESGKLRAAGPSLQSLELDIQTAFGKGGGATG